MSTANKLTYLNATKNKLKDVINYAGANIIDDTFRSYPEKLYNQFIDFINNGTDSLYNSLPKVTGEGTELTLNNTANSVLKLNLKGNTSQNSTTGKNKLDVTQNEVGSWTTDGSSSTNNRNRKGTQFIPVEPNTAYTFSVKSVSSTLRINEYGNTQAHIQRDEKSSVTSMTITTTANTYFLRWSINYDNTNVFTEEMLINLEPQIEQSSTATSFEPYTNGASPNPDYPQDIHVVTGDNDINVCGKNLLDTQYYERGSIDATTGQNATSTLNARGNNYIPVLPNETYTISTNTNVANLRLSEYASDKTHIQRDAISNNKQLTITTTANTYFVRWSFNYNNATTVTQEIIESLNLQLEQGSPATPYIEHQEQTYRVDFGGKNKFDKDNITIITAYLTENSTWAYSSDSKSFRISIEPNTTYCISCNNSNETIFRAALTDSDNIPTQGSLISTHGQIRYTNTNTPIVLTTNNTDKYILIQFSAAQFNTSIQTLQLELGSTATRYSRYVENPIELCKIDTYQDYIYKENGNWYKYNAIGKVVLDGTEDGWFIDNSGTVNYSYRLRLPDKVIAQIGLSNNFIRINIANNNTFEGFDIRNATTNKEIRIRYGVEDTIENFKTWLSTHNTEVYFISETATSTQITDTTLIEQLDEIYYNAVSYADETNISQTNADLPFVISATAIRKYEV